MYNILSPYGSVVERILGKDEVVSSILSEGTFTICSWVNLQIFLQKHEKVL